MRGQLRGPFFNRFQLTPMLDTSRRVGGPLQAVLTPNGPLDRWHKPCALRTSHSHLQPAPPGEPFTRACRILANLSFELTTQPLLSTVIDITLLQSCRSSPAVKPGRWGSAREMMKEQFPVLKAWRPWLARRKGNARPIRELPQQTMRVSREAMVTPLTPW